MNQWADAFTQYGLALSELADGDDENRARLLLHSSACLFWMLDIAKVREFATEALAIAPAGAQRLTAAATGFLAQADTSDGEVRAGAARYDSAHELAGDEPDLLVAQALQNYPMSLYWTGRFEDVAAAGRSLLVTARAHSDGSMVMNVLAVMAMSRGCAGHYRESAGLFREAERFGRDHGISRLVARAACMQVGSAFELGALDCAQERADIALEAASQAEFVPSIVSTEIDILLLAIARGDIGKAEALMPGVNETLSTAAGFHGWVWTLRVVLAHAQLALARGELDIAASKARVVIDDANRTGRIKYAVAGYRVLASVQVALGQPIEAIASLRAAATAALSISYPALVIQVAGDLLALTEDSELAATANKAVEMVTQQNDERSILAALERSESIARIRRAAG
jgi:hypothetical protein